tara:strand:- start:38 stop:439 length:402 start_codon:yes stop_codon:yes gene_type:complete
MAIKDIEEMIRPVSRGEETQMAMSEPHPMEGWYDMYDDMKSSGTLPEGIRTFDEFMEFVVPEMDIDIPYAAKGGIMELASASSGNDIIQSAIIWAAGLEQFGSIDAVVKSLEDGSTDMNGLINAYMDAVGGMN